jgi:hypothetical protein
VSPTMNGDGRRALRGNPSGEFVDTEHKSHVSRLRNTSDRKDRLFFRHFICKMGQAVQCSLCQRNNDGLDVGGIFVPASSSSSLCARRAGESVNPRTVRDGLTSLYLVRSQRPVDGG